MMERRWSILASMALALVLLSVLVVIAHARERAQLLQSFRAYRSDWDDRIREPIESQAVGILDHLVFHPDRDPELATAALSVLRRNTRRWYAMAPDVATHLKSWLDARLSGTFVGGDELRCGYDLLLQTESDDTDVYRARIAALAGDRSAAAAHLSEAAAVLQTAPASASVEEVALAWSALMAPMHGRGLNWLARQQADVATAEHAATMALITHLRKLLEAYDIKSDSVLSNTQPDAAMINVLDQRAVGINRTHPELRFAIRRTHALLARFAPEHHLQPLVDHACRSILRQRSLPWQGWLTMLSVIAILAVSLWRAIGRLIQGPVPVDVNAETMENVEPIDLDTDAETRSRSSASITDVG